MRLGKLSGLGSITVGPASSNVYMDGSARLMLLDNAAPAPVSGNLDVEATYQNLIATLPGARPFNPAVVKQAIAYYKPINNAPYMVAYYDLPGVSLGGSEAGATFGVLRINWFSQAGGVFGGKYGIPDQPWVSFNPPGVDWSTTDSPYNWFPFYAGRAPIFPGALLYDYNNIGFSPDIGLYTSTSNIVPSQNKLNDWLGTAIKVVVIAVLIVGAAAAVAAVAAPAAVAVAAPAAAPVAATAAIDQAAIVAALQAQAAEAIALEAAVSSANAAVLAAGSVGAALEAGTLGSAVAAVPAIDQAAIIAEMQAQEAAAIELQASIVSANEAVATAGSVGAAYDIPASAYTSVPEPTLADVSGPAYDPGLPNLTTMPETGGFNLPPWLQEQLIKTGTGLATSAVTTALKGGSGGTSAPSGTGGSGGTAGGTGGTGGTYYLPGGGIAPAGFNPANLPKIDANNNPILGWGSNGLPIIGYDINNLPVYGETPGASGINWRWVTELSDSVAKSVKNNWPWWLAVLAATVYATSNKDKPKRVMHRRARYALVKRL